MELVLLTFGVLLLALGGMAIKILLKPGGEFNGTCASNSEFNKRHGDGDSSCPSCGKQPGEACKNQKNAHAGAADQS